MLDAEQMKRLFVAVFVDLNLYDPWEYHQHQFSSNDLHDFWSQKLASFEQLSIHQDCLVKMNFLYVPVINNSKIFKIWIGYHYIYLLSWLVMTTCMLPQ